jgi:lactoylglutathione lyase
MSALSFAFTKIVVTDLDASEQFYSQALGLSRVTCIEFGEGPEELQEVVLAVPNGASGSAQLALIRYPNKPVHAPGETVIGFMVDDVDETAAGMINAGARITVPVQEMPDHRLKLAILVTPDGHTIEIIQTW